MNLFSRLPALLIVAALAACARGPEGSGASLTPRIPLASAPSESRFDFCVDPSSQVHLGNLAWLAFFSANEYAHARVVAPMLNELGFYNPQRALDRAWAGCADDLRGLREAQASRADELRAALGTPRLLELARGLQPKSGKWSACAKDYLASPRVPSDAFPAASFQRHLVQEVHPGSYLQFFSEGGFTDGGARFDDGSTQVMFARHKDLPVAILTFRGTELSKAIDLHTDLKLWLAPLSKRGFSDAWGSVHAGFLDAFYALEPLIMAKLDELRGTGVEIHVTGHSLGGALATLMAARLLRELDERPELRFASLTTFGSPRVGDAAFAAELAKALYRHQASAIRVRNERDAVTAFPGVALDYVHVGMLAYLQEDSLTIAPAEEPPYGVVSTADHDSSGMPPSGALGGPLPSGYYRRLLSLHKSGKHPEFEGCN